MSSNRKKVRPKGSKSLPPKLKQLARRTGGKPRHREERPATVPRGRRGRRGRAARPRRGGVADKQPVVVLDDDDDDDDGDVAMQNGEDSPSEIQKTTPSDEETSDGISSESSDSSDEESEGDRKKRGVKRGNSAVAITNGKPKSKTTPRNRNKMEEADESSDESSDDESARTAKKQRRQPPRNRNKMEDSDESSDESSDDDEPARTAKKQRHQPPRNRNKMEESDESDDESSDDDEPARTAKKQRRSSPVNRNKLEADESDENDDESSSEDEPAGARVAKKPRRRPPRNRSRKQVDESSDDENANAHREVEDVLALGNKLAAKIKRLQKQRLKKKYRPLLAVTTWMDGEELLRENVEHIKSNKVCLATVSKPGDGKSFLANEIMGVLALPSSGGERSETCVGFHVRHDADAGNGLAYCQVLDSEAFLDLLAKLGLDNDKNVPEDQYEQHLKNKYKKCLKRLKQLGVPTNLNGKPEIPLEELTDKLDQLDIDGEGLDFLTLLVIGLVKVRVCFSAELLDLLHRAGLELEILDLPGYDDADCNERVRQQRLAASMYAAQHVNIDIVVLVSRGSRAAIDPAAFEYLYECGILSPRASDGKQRGTVYDEERPMCPALLSIRNYRLGEMSQRRVKEFWADDDGFLRRSTDMPDRHKDVIRRALCKLHDVMLPEDSGEADNAEGDGAGSSSDVDRRSLFAARPSYADTYQMQRAYESIRHVVDNAHSIIFPEQETIADEDIVGPHGPYSVREHLLTMVGKVLAERRRRIVQSTAEYAAGLLNTFESAINRGYRPAADDDAMPALDPAVHSKLATALDAERPLQRVEHVQEQVDAAIHSVLESCEEDGLDSVSQRSMYVLVTRIFDEIDGNVARTFSTWMDATREAMRHMEGGDTDVDSDDPGPSTPAAPPDPTVAHVLEALQAHKVLLQRQASKVPKLKGSSELSSLMRVARGVRRNLDTFISEHNLFDQDDAVPAAASSSAAAAAAAPKLATVVRAFFQHADVVARLSCFAEKVVDHAQGAVERTIAVLTQSDTDERAPKTRNNDGTSNKTLSVEDMKSLRSVLETVKRLIVSNADDGDAEEPTIKVQDKLRKPLIFSASANQGLQLPLENPDAGGSWDEAPPSILGSLKAKHYWGAGRRKKLLASNADQVTPAALSRFKVKVVEKPLSRGHLDNVPEIKVRIEDKRLPGTGRIVFELCGKTLDGLREEVSATAQQGVAPICVLADLQRVRAGSKIEWVKPQLHAYLDELARAAGEDGDDDPDGDLPMSSPSEPRVKSMMFAVVPTGDLATHAAVLKEDAKLPFAHRLHWVTVPSDDADVMGEGHELTLVQLLMERLRAVHVFVHADGINVRELVERRWKHKRHATAYVRGLLHTQSILRDALNSEEIMQQRREVLSNSKIWTDVYHRAEELPHVMEMIHSGSFVLNRLTKELKREGEAVVQDPTKFIEECAGTTVAKELLKIDEDYRRAVAFVGLVSQDDKGPSTKKVVCHKRYTHRVSNKVIQDLVLLNLESLQGRYFMQPEHFFAKRLTRNELTQRQRELRVGTKAYSWKTRLTGETGKWLRDYKYWDARVWFPLQLVLTGRSGFENMMFACKVSKRYDKCVRRLESEEVGAGGGGGLAAAAAAAAAGVEGDDGGGASSGASSGASNGANGGGAGSGERRSKKRKRKRGRRKKKKKNRD